MSNCVIGLGHCYTWYLHLSWNCCKWWKSVLLCLLWLGTLLAVDKALNLWCFMARPVFDGGIGLLIIALLAALFGFFKLFPSVSQLKWVFPVDRVQYLTYFTVKTGFQWRINNHVWQVYQKMFGRRIWACRGKDPFSWQLDIICCVWCEPYTKSCSYCVYSVIWSAELQRKHEKEQT